MSKIQNYNKRQKVVKQVRDLSEDGYNYSQIGIILKLDRRTVKKHINSNYKYNNYRKRISDLDP
ncbi:MAG: helix-turn-helix transcriptional regulator [Sphaerochaetaceae bacterium]|nr:helix-turn-helix transcriptional regulator [Sphaerochaetaceae bacterium]